MFFRLIILIELLVVISEIIFFGIEFVIDEGLIFLFIE